MNLPSSPGVFQSLFVGIVATAILDSLALLLRRGFGLPVTDWGHVGRWVAGISSGTFRHASIAAAPDVAHERLIGWSTHYLVGVAYAVLYLVSIAALSETPTIYTAGLFGLVTVLAPWLILQPCLGAGYFATNASNPRRTLALNLLAHGVFGIGLYLGTVMFVLVA